MGKSKKEKFRGRSEKEKNYEFDGLLRNSEKKKPKRPKNKQYFHEEDNIDEYDYLEDY